MVDGLEVLTAIKADERTQAIPVVIITSSAEDPDVQKAYQLGANSYVINLSSLIIYGRNDPGVGILTG